MFGKGWILRLSRLASRRIPAPIAVFVVALAAAVTGFFAYGSGDATAGTTTLNVGAGVGTGQTAGNVYTPGEFSVNVGGSAKWTITSDEPHSITFGAYSGGGSPDTWPITGFDEPPPGPPGPVDLGSTTYDGTGFVHTGIQFGGSTAEVQFTEEGEYEFYCVIHPGMGGTVNVIPEGEDATTQAEADADAQETEDLILGQVAPLQQEATNAITSETKSNGTKQWNIFTTALNDPAPMPGGGTGYLELLMFIPENLQIKAGDTVNWDSPAPHAVTFPGGAYTLETLAMSDPFAVPVAKPSENYTPGTFFNSGVLALGPGAPTEFELTFPTAGTFGYVCVLHFPLGQDAVITVSAAATVTPTPGSLPSTGGTPETGGGTAPWAVWLALLSAGAVMLASIEVARRKIRR